MSETDTTTHPAPNSDQPPAGANADAGPAVDEEIDLAIIEGLAEEEGTAPLPAEAQCGGASPIAASDQSLSVLGAVQALGERIGRRLDGLQTIFERELRAEATRERVVDRLHAELQEYKQDFLLKVQRPIFVDLVQLHDDIAKMIDSKTASEGDLERIAQFRGVLESIQTAIEDILYRQGVEPFVVEGTAFDPRKQRAVSTVPTDDASLNKSVAGRLRRGFAAADKVIRPELVTVYTWRPSPPAAEG
jgi:molecular chaperone GrpE